MSRGHKHDQLKYGLSLYISLEEGHQTRKLVPRVLSYPPYSLGG